MIIKCKMCGGDIEFTPGATYGTCEYCGSTSTIPKAEDETKLNRYNRANHFRRQCEFDKALAAYEKLLEQDDTDAEAHWGAVISRYGIEYVEDPATGRRVPTCHRVQVASILADADYLAAVENAPDAESRRLYEAQGAEIAEIQKGILAISANEKPYDVFICYKETDENGQRTRDSQWAQEVYYGLTEQGYKVFFSRITLEDKLGQQYEPYIFAALNSARVMVVIGSRPEHFGAVWVKNEWSRYLALMAKDRKRLLIPCYRGMDPYDLPEELSALQSQDMSKIGFMQDLLRGIRKVLDAEKKPEANEQPQMRRRAAQAEDEGAAGPGAASLLKRAQLFMEDGAFKEAGAYLDRVLDIDPECAEAYAAKVCVACGLPRESELAQTPYLYDELPDWKKALRFANPRQRAVYEGYAAAVHERVAQQQRDRAYDCAMEMATNPKATREALDDDLKAYRRTCSWHMGRHTDGSRRDGAQENEQRFDRAVQANDPGDISEQGYLTAAEMFGAVGDERAAVRAQQCRKLAEQARKKAAYEEACGILNIMKNNTLELDRAAQMLAGIAGYADAARLAQQAKQAAEDIRAKAYGEAVEKMRAAGAESAQWKFALNLLRSEGLNGYRDVEQLRREAEQRMAECEAAEKKQAELAAAKKKRNQIIGAVVLAVAVAAFLVVTRVIIPDNHYKEAEALLAAGQYQQASEAFAQAGSYKDAVQRSKETSYTAAEELMAAGDEDRAVIQLAKAVDYHDALKQSYAIRYRGAEGGLAVGDDHTVGLKRDGTVVAVGDNDYGRCKVSGWRDIVAVAAGWSHTVGLKRDGTVVAVGRNSFGQCKVSGWRDIVAVAAGEYHTVGLKRDGTVVAVGRNDDGQCKVSGWRDIVAVSAGYAHTVGLKRDGTVVAVGDNDYGQCKVSGWRDIVAVSAGAYHTVGLKRDGTVVAVGMNHDGRCEVSGWQDIVAVSAGWSHMVGLKRDGTVVAVGYNDDGRCEVSGWRDIVAVSAGGGHTVGLKRDGTVVAVGGNSKGQCEVSGWIDIGGGLTLE